ncbi:MAG TPA: hypothetical protein VGB39_04395, partial [Sphingomicrobium sp.]
MQTWRWPAPALALFAASASLAQSADSNADFLKAGGRSFIIENVRVIDGTGAAAQAGMTVIIDKGVITHVGRAKPPI